MWMPGEEQRLSAKTLYTKKPGTLYLTSQRIVWSGDDQTTVSIPFHTIKAQLVNPDTAKNIALRITLKPDQDGKEVNHSFVFPGSDAVAVRERFKEAIRRILAELQNSTATDTDQSNRQTATTTRPTKPTQSKLPEAIQLRMELLKSNKELQKLHRELVLAGHIGEEEFWANKKHLVETQRMRRSQKKGHASAWLDLRPVTEEGRDVKFTLTPQIIHAIFFQHPSVKRAYDAYVPDKLSESAFWKRYFKSRFFHRNRAVASTMVESDEIFDKCLEEDEAAVSGSKRKRTDEISLLLDLSATEEDYERLEKRPDWTMIPGRVESARSLIQRFNHHSEQVVKALQEKSKRVLVEPTLLDATVLPDLQAEKSTTKILLNIRDQRRYFDNQTLAGDGSFTETSNVADIVQFYKRFADMQLNLEQMTMQREEVMAVHQELNQAIRRSGQESQRTRDHVDRIPANALEELRNCQRTGIELLRHFWAALPSTAPQKRAKCQRLLESLSTIEKRAQAALALAVSAVADDQQAVQKFMDPLYTSIAKAREALERKPALPAV